MQCDECGEPFEFTAFERAMDPRPVPGRGWLCRECRAKTAKAILDPDPVNTDAITVMRAVDAARSWSNPWVANVIMTLFVEREVLKAQLVRALGAEP